MCTEKNAIEKNVREHKYEHEHSLNFCLFCSVVGFNLLKIVNCNNWRDILFFLSDSSAITIICFSFL